MAPMSERNVHIVGFFLTLAYCSIRGEGDTALKVNKVEFKTQAPPDAFPEAPKDCYEFLYGKLSARRKHGTTWQNGGADCSNCTCDNGDIRCFIHFCSEPSTGYMTPPTTDGVFERTVEVHEEESSGYPPQELDDESEGGLEEADWSSGLTKSLRKKGYWDAEGEAADRTENETHDVENSFFCGKTCNKICPHGYKLDPASGCWKCGCVACPAYVPCKTKCPYGFALDPSTGCRTCTCAAPSEDEDIVFTDITTLNFQEGKGEEKGRGGGGGGAGAGARGRDRGGGEEEEEVQVEPSEGGKHQNSSSSSSSSSTSEEQEEKEEENEGEEWLFTSSFSQGRGTEAGGEESAVTSFPSIKEGTLGFHDNGEEPCNTTQLRGCLDGSQRVPVGGRWSRGPCVSCRCVASGYSECNITQCHALHICPQSRRTTPAGACCAICEEATPTSELLDVAESRSTSRVPPDLLPPNQGGGGSLFTKQEFVDQVEEEATIKSIPKDDQSPLLLILIPMGVLCSGGMLLFAHLWRRYHRDKYDINAYRPEEKQKLRPVKTLNDDTSSLGHV